MGPKRNSGLCVNLIFEIFTGAGEEIRTPDFNLGKVAEYQ